MRVEVAAPLGSGSGAAKPLSLRTRPVYAATQHRWMRGRHMAQASARPSPGRPRPYHFPTFHRTVLDSGMQVITCHLPGRPLGSARLIVEAGSANEPDDQGGVAVLAARTIDEGTEN